MLKVEGYVAIADLDSEDGSFHSELFKGHKGFDRNEMMQLLKNSGFCNIRVTDCYHIIKETADGVSKSFPVFLMTGEKKPDLH